MALGNDLTVANGIFDAASVKKQAAATASGPVGYVQMLPAATASFAVCISINSNTIPFVTAMLVYALIANISNSVGQYKQP